MGGSLRVWGVTDRLNEDQSVSVQIADAELPPSVEGLVKIFFKFDSFMIARLTGKRGLRSLELSRLEKLIKAVDL
jgi:hypothetical protein